MILIIVLTVYVGIVLIVFVLIHGPRFKEIMIADKEWDDLPFKLVMCFIWPIVLVVAAIFYIYEIINRTIGKIDAWMERRKIERKK